MQASLLKRTEGIGPEQQIREAVIKSLSAPGHALIMHFDLARLLLIHAFGVSPESTFVLFRSSCRSKAVSARLHYAARAVEHRHNC